MVLVLTRFYLLDSIYNIVYVPGIRARSDIEM
jgi:hypothetical protein